MAVNLNYKIGVVLIVIIGFAMYAVNFNNRLFWDDDDWIVNNQGVHQFSWTNLKFIFQNDTLAGIGLRSNYYRPFLFLSFLLNYIMVGTKPWLYHLTNNFLHIANALFVFFFLTKFLKEKRIAFLAALIFLIHPLQTEAVTYISGRGDPMLVFFMFLALWLFFKSQNQKALSLGYWLLIAGSILTQILAILSRETAFLFPVYLMIILMTFNYAKDKFWPAFRKSLSKALPYFIASFIYGGLRLTVLNFDNTLNFYQQSNVYADNLLYRVYTFLHVLLIYFKLLFLPAGLHMDREILVNTSIFQIQVWPALLLIPLLLYLVIRDFNKTRLWFFSWGVFFVNLAPTSGIFPINGLLYEHWLYFSIFGLATLASYYLVRLFDYLKKRGKLWVYRLILASLTVYGSFFLFQSVKRNLIWGKPVEFYENILNYEPNSVRALTNLANLYSDQDNLAKAEKLLRRAVEVGDIQPQPYYNLANILRDRGDIAGAIEFYKKSLEVNNHFPYAYQNLAVIYARQGNLKEALNNLEKLSQILPNSPEVWYNMALVQSAIGDQKAALASANKSLSLLSQNSKPYLEVEALIKKISHDKRF